MAMVNTNMPFFLNIDKPPFKWNGYENICLHYNSKRLVKSIPKVQTAIPAEIILLRKNLSNPVILSPKTSIVTFYAMKKGLSALFFNILHKSPFQNSLYLMISQHR